MCLLHNNRQLLSTLIPGKVSERYFLLLIAVCTLRNKNMQSALEDVLVNGLSRQDACKKHNVSQSYFSVKYHHMQTMSRKIALIHASEQPNGDTQRKK